jgi:hypothetical protein
VITALRFGAWYPRADYGSARAAVDGGRPPTGTVATVTLLMRRSSGEIQRFEYRASGTYGDDTYVEWSAAPGRIAAAEGWPNPVVTRRTWPMPWPDETEVSFRFDVTSGYIAASIAASEATAPTLPLAPTVPLRTWPEVRPSAKLGQWVRRWSWPTSRRLTYMAGAGTTRAVAMIEDPTGLRVAQAADFGRAEFLAHDWIVVPTAETENPPDPARPPEPEDPDDTQPTPPPVGDYALTSSNGVLAWTPIEDCPD